jgi:hypothetical protein
MHIDTTVRAAYDLSSRFHLGMLVQTKDLKLMGKVNAKEEVQIAYLAGLNGTLQK